MLKWVQSGLSAVAGTAEPEYGPDAIHPITSTIQDKPSVYRETELTDFNWQSPNYTNVETQTFYFTDLKQGYSGFAQIIHSNIMGVHTTAQFTFRLYNNTNPEDENLIWTSTKLEEFRYEGSNFYAKDLSIVFSEDNTSVEIKSHVNPESIVDFKISRLTPGVIFGKDGTTLYGDDVENPWGSMRHLFWPRCAVSGTIKLGKTNNEVSIDGYTMFVMALQGMKPHHAAKSWNFLNFQSENFSAVQMEFTTPISYDTTKVNVGIITTNDKILVASINNQVDHIDSKVDEIGWPVPASIDFNFNEFNSTDDVIGNVEGKLTHLVERVDVMAEIPQFVKNIVSGVAGTKPYIYQFCNDMTINVKDHESEKGVAFNEATFISE